MKTVRTLAAALAVAALALTGCTTPPAAAASVEGVRVANETVTATGDVLVSVGANPAVSSKQAASDLTLGEASRQIAAQTGTEVGDDERAAILAVNAGASTVASTPQGAAWGEAVTTTYLLIEKLGEEAFAEKVQALDITVNPRYGTWEPERLTLADSSLSRASQAQAVNP